jgi:hypothetical protein
MISVSWRICQSIFVADAFFCDRGVKNEFMAGGQHVWSRTSSLWERRRTGGFGVALAF